HYGNDADGCQDYFLETKISSFEGRYKTVEKISSEVAKAKLAYGIFDRSLGLISPTLTVSYRRRYLHFFGSRITIDTGIIYQKPTLDLYLAEKFLVIEIKSSSTEVCSEVVPILSAQRVRFSKYCRGMLRFGERQYGRSRVRYDCTPDL
ncbi:MAG: VTC domain-containing protein, partial [Paracoccaceae bacterium]